MSKVTDFFMDMSDLETERLILRKFHLEDVNDVYEYGSDEEVNKYVKFETYKSLHDAQNYIDYVLTKYSKGEIAPWAIIHKKDNKMIGYIEFIEIKEDHYWGEISYVFNRNYWGKGLGSEAVKEILNLAFNIFELNRVQARCINENIASYRIMEKVGMKYEGTSKEAMLKDNNFHDIVQYAILKKEHYILNNRFIKEVD